MGGPDEIDGAGLKMDLEKPNKTSLKEYKIAAWVNQDFAPVNQETQNRVTNVAETITSNKGIVDFEAKPDFDILEFYGYLCITSSPLPWPQEAQKKIIKNC